MQRHERIWRMSSSSWRNSWTALLTLVTVLGANIAAADDLSQVYCSSENTGSSFTPDSSIYQSNGYCTTACGNVNGVAYAFAIVQGNNCWCDNYIPAQQVSVGKCNTPCIGFPYENCGNEDAGLFGYIQIGTPSGTAGASSAKSTDGSDSSSTPTPTPTTTPTTTQSSSTTTQTTFGPPSSQSQQTSSTTSMVLSVQILTVSDRPVTQTITSTPTIAGSAADGNTQQQPLQSKSKSVSAGLIAGVVIAGVVAALAIAGLLFFFWRRRKQQQQLEAAGGAAMAESGTTSSRPTRNTSVLSKTGLLEKVYPSAAMASRPHASSNANSQHGINDMSGGVSPISERRRSQPLFYDQRLNPATLMDLDNGSRVSINTLPDNRDYSRTLNVTNPDPHNSWQ